MRSDDLRLDIKFMATFELTMQSHGSDTLELIVEDIWFLCVLEHVIAARIELSRV